MGGVPASIATAAREALSNIEHPEVRTLALELAATAAKPWEVVDLLTRNYRRGDELLLARLAERRSDDEHYHWLVLSARRFFDAHLTADAAPALRTFCENGPCSLCRSDMVEHLLTLGLLPDRIREECRYDADLKTRAFVAS